MPCAVLGSPRPEGQRRENSSQGSYGNFLAHGFQGAGQGGGGGGHCEEGGPAEPGQGQPEPPACRLEEETPPAPPVSQGADAILEKALLRLPSPRSWFFCALPFVYGGALQWGPFKLPQPEEARPQRPPPSSSNSSSVQEAGHATHPQLKQRTGEDALEASMF
ncbi:hypothetical protein COCON_G00042150 [Conger conger]|uniref:Uncharacterized protein n=1 Tax=Conger conger TaxID=82655 RepID=A0A9Q1DU20_CONCO|nr:hypothetical protein COCON_G00042150 [Conger conger]